MTGTREICSRREESNIWRGGCVSRAGQVASRRWNATTQCVEQRATCGRRSHGEGIADLGESGRALPLDSAGAAVECFETGVVPERYCILVEAQPRHQESGREVEATPATCISAAVFAATAHVALVAAPTSAASCNKRPRPYTRLTLCTHLDATLRDIQRHLSVVTTACPATHTDTASHPPLPHLVSAEAGPDPHETYKSTTNTATPPQCVASSGMELWTSLSLIAADCWDQIRQLSRGSEA